MGKKTSKTTSTSAPPSWAVPILQGAGNTILNTVQGNAGNLQGLSNSLSGELPAIWSMAGDSSALQPGLGYTSDVLSGKYLNSNPYTQALAHQAGQDAANQVNSTFSLAGRTGSGDHATQLARGVDQAENQILFQNYQNERGQQANAAGLLPEYNASKYAGLTPALAATQLAGQLPYYGLNSLSGIGGLYGGYGSQTQTQPGGLLGGLLGAASNMFSFAPISLSDRRLKTNIRKVGEAKDGLGIYEWNWRSDPSGQKVRGVIADEVEKLRPWAFVPNFNGEYAGVNYAALGDMA